MSSDGTQLALPRDESLAHVKLSDIASCRVTRRLKLTDERGESLKLAYTDDGRLLAAGILERRFKMWDLTTKKEQELGRTAIDFGHVKFSSDGRLLALSENYLVKVWDTGSARELVSLKAPNSGAIA